MRNRRCPHTALLTPRASIEDPSQSRKQNVSPVEVNRALVEVRKPEENSRRQQRPMPSEATLQKVLHPAAKEKLLRDGNKEKSEEPPQHNVRHRRNISVEVEKSKQQSKHNRNRSIKPKLSQANPQIG
jgi:hypothetical protein